MSATTDGPSASDASNGHSRCFLCGNLNPRSLNLSFEDSEEGGVRTSFESGADLQGYDDILHGGVISALLDAAMTHSLFHQGIQAVTGDLRVRFLRPVPCGAILEIRARVLSSRPPLYNVSGEILLDGEVMAWAEAKFMERRKH